jgi:hypothetical protein
MKRQVCVDPHGQHNTHDAASWSVPEYSSAAHVKHTMNTQQPARTCCRDALLVVLGPLLVQLPGGLALARASQHRLAALSADLLELQPALVFCSRCVDVGLFLLVPPADARS